jgi:hypothetical protein
MGTKAKSDKKLSFQERLKRFLEQARGAARNLPPGTDRNELIQRTKENE